MSSNSTWTQEYAAENSGQPLLNVCIAFAILEILFLIVFVFSWYLNKNHNHNTRAVCLLILVGYILCFVGIVIGIFKITNGGAGFHAKTLRPQKIKTMLQLSKAHEVIYVLSLPFGKLAILGLFLRLFRTKTSLVISYITGVIIIATFLFGFIASFANCRPFRSYWDREVQAHCTMDLMTAFRFYSIPNIVTDFIMLVMPLPSLWRLKIGKLSKLGVVLTFLASTVGIVTAIMRFVAFMNVDIFEDITYLAISTSIWTIIEPGVYVMAASIPTLRPLIRRVIKATRKSYSESQRATPGGRSSTTMVGSVSPDHLRVPQKTLSTREQIQSIGQRPTRNLRFDDYHHMQHFPGPLITPMSEVEESTLYTDIVIPGSTQRLGGDPERTPRKWSLEPILVSPIRTSFFFADSEQGSEKS